MTRPRLRRTLAAGRCECMRDGEGHESVWEMVPSSAETPGSSEMPLTWGPALTALFCSCNVEGRALGESLAPPVSTACFCRSKGRDAGAPCATLAIADGSLAGGTAADRTAGFVLAVEICEALSSLAGPPCVSAASDFKELSKLDSEPPLLSWPTCGVFGPGDNNGTCDEHRTTPIKTPAGASACVCCLLRTVRVHVRCAAARRGMIKQA